ncbi:hypothetical protein J1N35_004154 [Gossypium stocksii]|uniref:Uncharacterized protein n=1 Tax=Gossypium stocksii TaxID=47602 RepID=A0A9D4AHE3_9ROSI|nr:hypothetical protein J1N35_004154 [Gossypium stocksii]
MRSISNIGFNIRLTRTNDVLLTTCTEKETSNPGHETEIALFSKPESVPTKPEGSDSNSKGLHNARANQFYDYKPLPHMLNVDIIRTSKTFS